MKRTSLRAAGVSALAAVALGIAAPAATAATVEPVAKSDRGAGTKSADEARRAAEDAAKAASEAAARAAAKSAADAAARAAAEAAAKSAAEAARKAAEAAKAAAAPSVSVRKIFLGKGIVASLDVSFDYTCTAATDHLEVTLASDPGSGKPTVLKGVRAKKDLQCDGARHSGFYEWTGNGGGAFPPGSTAKATVALYGKDNALQAPVAEKTAQLGYDLPTSGSGALSAGR
ncbi:hypothetical protein LE181_03340 [Streptomyces sp. SCA3-4]|uniref:hypothetical protein n=1 Tax=Streptomyces sichuanensis TaxID=2871810 RepID=UPI001CE33E86|nr:hypothetical protein [Streptomyces sichuanensis]MCA6091203.1 hypothetical protein [Streptomyces sichuanensis]